MGSACGNMGDIVPNGSSAAIGKSNCRTSLDLQVQEIEEF